MLKCAIILKVNVNGKQTNKQTKLDRKGAKLMTNTKNRVKKHTKHTHEHKIYKTNSKQDGTMLEQEKNYTHITGNKRGSG